MIQANRLQYGYDEPAHGQVLVIVGKDRLLWSCACRAYHSSSAHGLCGDVVISPRGDVNQVGAVAGWCHGVGAVLSSASSKQNLNAETSLIWQQLCSLADQAESAAANARSGTCRGCLCGDVFPAVRPHGSHVTHDKQHMGEDNSS